jgi:hypothetical protein
MTDDKETPPNLDTPPHHPFVIPAHPSPVIPAPEPESPCQIAARWVTHHDTGNKPDQDMGNTSRCPGSGSRVRQQKQAALKGPHLDH